MVVFTIGAQVLDTILIKSTSLAVDVLFSLTTWTTKAIIRSVWVTQPNEHDLLQSEIKKLKSEVDTLSSIVQKTQKLDNEFIVI